MLPISSQWSWLRRRGGVDVHPEASPVMTMTMPSPRRALRMVQRNLLVYKHTWLVILSGFFEPVFYLAGIGVGLGALVPDIEGVNYAAFVAPGLLAASCMNGAITDGFFNIFFKLHFQNTYDGILATPMRVPDVALGEALWALSRGSLYAAAFLVVLLVLGETSGQRMLLSPLAILAWPAALLASAAFSALALCITSFARKIQDFDLVMNLIFLPMFLFSGTFFSIGSLPVPVAAVIQVTPLYHGTEMLRQLTTGRVGATLLVHVAYLMLMTVVAFTIAMRRLERALIK
jgi:lipooligosaccharide transport system permease protein